MLLLGVLVNLVIIPGHCRFLGKESKLISGALENHGFRVSIQVCWLMGEARDLQVDSCSVLVCRPRGTGAWLRRQRYAGVIIPRCHDQFIIVSSIVVG